AIRLPDQAERIIRTEFAPLDAVLRSFRGNPAEQMPATTAYLLRDVDFVDGVLYAANAERHLRRREGSRLILNRPQRSVSGAMYETWVGNRWFGNWLLDDCLTYRLAEEAGQPVTSAVLRSGHVPRYAELLSMTPERIGDVHFEELILFDDQGSNSGRMARAQDMRNRLLKDRDLRPSPGVFLYRGRSGDARILENEDEIAGKLQDQYGFQVIFPEDASVDELLSACGAASVVAGVEGSQLCHAVAVMPPGATLLTLQPDNRVTSALKILTDRWRQRFGLVVGWGSEHGFRIAWDDVQRTLAMI
ncbi:glycosyltransferase family 61 protein, partial [Paracoccus salsus]|uniref:glycosyltransferase family 61 protein n=1 Tax=Paracoccus salsus TaxID=2911061 RepID=UPI001F478443